MPSRQSTIFFLVTSVTCGLALFLSSLGTRPLFGEAEIRDFAFYLMTIDGFLEHGSPGIATPTAILNSFTTVLGVIPPPDALVMPNPMSPSAIIIWAPLLIPLHSSLNAAYCLWLGISWGTLFMAIRRAWQRSAPRGVFATALFTTAVLGTITSPPARICVDIGQTTLFAVGIISLLIQHLSDGSSERSGDWWAGILLFLLSLKAHYFIMGASLLCMERRWFGLGVAVFLTVGSVVACDPVGKYGLMSTFIETMTRYSNGQSQANGFFWGNFHAHTPTWLSVSAGAFSNSTREFINKVGILSGVLLYGILFLRASLFSRRSRLVATTALVLGVYLCFAPYLSTYDQLLIIIPIIAAAGQRCFGSHRTVLIALIATLITLSNGNATAFIWITKLVLLGWIGLTAIISTTEPRANGRYSSFFT